MPRQKRVTCRMCERHVDECGPLSARGKCEDCGIAGVEQAVTAMYAGRGPIYDKWARNTQAGLRKHVERYGEPRTKG